MNRRNRHEKAEHAAPDKSIAYLVTVDGKAYQQQVFTVRSET